ncbi:MAG: hypothetical protein MI861_02990 [Pirellulales bacterium]|nr:hypothetical protein [Pirellulales bacterium]
MTPDTAISTAAALAEAQDVFGLLERQRGLYRELKSLSDQQDALIAQGATEQLLSLLAQRQKLVDGLGQVSASIAPYRSRIAEIADRAEGDLGPRMRSMVEEVRGLLEAIIERDEKGKADLSTARDKVAGQIRQAAGAASAAGAYSGGASSSSGPRFTQQKG